MQIRLRQRQEFSEGTRIRDNPHHGSRGTVPRKPSAAPFALSTSKVNLSDNAPPQQVWIVGTNDFTYEFVARRPAKSIVAAPELEVGVANTSQQQSNERESFRALRPTDIAHLHTAILEMNS